MIDVHSDMVNKVGHDSKSDEMHVEWSSGKVSIYSGVSRETFDRVRTSYSVGKAINEEIKPGYRHRYA